MVTAPEAASLLAYAAEFDNRGASGDAVRAWTTVLADYGFQECRDAITAHYSHEHRWIMPSDIVKALDVQHAANTVSIIDQLDALELPEWLAVMEDGPEFNAAWVGWRKEQARRIREGLPLDTGSAESVDGPAEVRALVQSMREALVS